MLGATRCILHDVQRAWGDDLGMIHAALAIIVRHVPCTDVMTDVVLHSVDCDLGLGHVPAMY